MTELRLLHIDDGWEAEVASAAGTDHWTARLPGLLAETGLAVAGQESVTGEKLSIRDATRELMRRRLSGPFDAVTLQVGTWDVSSDRTEQQLLADFGTILDLAIELAAGDGWHTVLVGPNTLICETVEEAERMNLIRIAGLNAVIERTFPHYVDIHPITVDVLENYDGDRGATYPELSRAHAASIAHTLSEALLHRPRELPDEFAEELLRSPN